MQTERNDNGVKKEATQKKNKRRRRWLSQITKKREWGLSSHGEYFEKLTLQFMSHNISSDFLASSSKVLLYGGSPQPIIENLFTEAKDCP